MSSTESTSNVQPVEAPKVEVEQPKEPAAAAPVEAAKVEV